ncbi:SRPBCC domain-containing protein [Nocardioides sp. GXZ039]|uniref:SRPBCC domain-containing protein n=1 Tax=Nocardioides sp. GXZ039 TaxID=3136018 RepID=UPI0030F43B64
MNTSTSPTTPAIPAIRRQVLVSCDPAAAYDLFWRHIGAWWPIESLGCFGAGSSVALDGDRIVETGPTGETAVWGTLIDADEPRSVSFTWHPGRDADRASRVAVAFAPAGDATLVTLEHDGWEVYADPAAARAEYAGGWLGVLDRFAEAGPADPARGELWLVLEHTAASGRAGTVFADPDFPRHLAFLRTLADRGLLVAAGPLPDQPGNGMAIVRASDAATAADVVVAAQRDDGSVVAGLLDVRVRPWQVALAG